jgi:hypothetical protein
VPSVKVPKGLKCLLVWCRWVNEQQTVEWCELVNELQGMALIRTPRGVRVGVKVGRHAV